MDNGRYRIIFNNKDSMVFPADKEFRTIIAEISSTSGFITQYTSIKTGNFGLSLAQLSGNDNLLIMNGNISGTGLCKIKIEQDSSAVLLGQNNIFLIGFNASTFQHKFTNFFDSLNYKLSITDIYNDSLYTFTGETRGNQKFGFSGEAVFAKDHLKDRPTSFNSNFIATYTTSNRIKDLWYLTTHPTNIYSSFLYNSTVFSKNGSFYLGVNIPYHAELGLGSRKFDYSAGNRAITLLKYNCKPTAFFSYSKSETKVNFKNNSTGLSNYTWQFTKTNSANTKDAEFLYPKSGGVFTPRLIVSNTCGTDTFETEINLAPSSVTNYDKTYFTIYPNPTSSKLSLRLENDLGIKNLQFLLYDISGKIMKCPHSQITESIYEIEILNISNGIYFLKVQSDEMNIMERVTILR